MLATAIVFGCLSVVLGVLYWRAQRRAAQATDELARIETERRVDERQLRDAKPSAKLGLYRQARGTLLVLNTGPGRATEVSIEVGDGSAVRLAGVQDSPVRKLADIEPGGRTSTTLRAAAEHEELSVTLHWRDPTGYQRLDYEATFDDLPMAPANASIMSPSRQRRRRPGKPHGI